MPWQEVTKMSSKKEFVRLVLEKNGSMSELCRRFKISRKTGHQLLKRYQGQGEEGLKEQSRRPHNSPQKTPPEVENKIINVRKEKPYWGGRKIRAWLLKRGEKTLPSASSITRILQRHGHIDEGASEQRQAYQRFEHEAPNDLWQMDFKGHFEMASGRCHPLTLIDDHSRFAIGLKACEGETASIVKDHLIELFKQYGLPRRMNMDNGVPWACVTNKLRYTGLTVWIMRVGVQVSFSRIKHPQTNGKDERFHRTLKNELLQFHYFRDVKHAQQQFDSWREEYNLERPHEALAMKAPITRYQVSKRAYPKQLPAIEYRTTDQVRKVDKVGKISYQNKDIHLSEALRGEYVALREVADGKYDIFFCQQKIHTIDFKN